jgi:DNA-binding NtrC family response regulator
MNVNTNSVNVLLIEDSRTQQRFLARSLELSSRCTFNVKCAGTLARGIQAMDESPVDVVLLDLSLPDSLEGDTLERFQEKHPRVPVVILTSTDDDALGQKLVQAGAQDYLIKSEVSTRTLVRALIYAVERKRNHLERERLLRELEDSLHRISTLHGLLPICGYCKKVRDDTGYWNKIETYISAHNDVTLTHGICPECAQVALSEFEKKGINAL